MNVRNFVLLGRSDRQALLDRLGSVVARWRMEWCPADGERADITFCDETEVASLAAHRWRTGTLPGGLAASVGVGGLVAGALIPALISGVTQSENETPATSQVAEELQSSAIEALIAASLSEVDRAGVGQGIRWGSDQPDKSMSNRNSGFVVFRCRIQMVDIVVALHPGLSERYLKSSSAPVRKSASKLTPIRNLVGTQRLTVEVCAGTAELKVSELATLAVDDVIALDRCLTEPLAVQTNNGDAVCMGHLGILGDRKAIQLTISQSDEV
jgi:flagellar motor switch/type III secretory pathway protein FliN